jgi:hypothetical protein
LSAAPLSPEQIAKILEELSRVETQVTGKRLAGRRNAVEAFRQAAGSDRAALELYYNCIKAVDFDQQGKSSSEFREWRERQADRTETEGRVLAMRMQLQWLVLTLRAAEGEDRKKLLPEVESFLVGLVKNAETLGGDFATLQRENVTATAFGRAYELDQSVRMEDWAFVPGNIGQVYERIVLPLHREESPGTLAAAWDRRVQLETELLKERSPDDPTAMERFATETLPRLQWQKSADIFRHGQQQEGALAILKLLQEHADHPDAGEWIGGFRNLLVPPDAPDSAGS